jgi:hypothetical protein
MKVDLLKRGGVVHLETQLRNSEKQTDAPAKGDLLHSTRELDLCRRNIKIR